MPARATNDPEAVREDTPAVDRAAEGEAVTLTLPLPPSVNSYWRSVPATRNSRARVLISENGRRFKAACQIAAMGQCRKPFTEKVSVRGIVYFRDHRRDLDNTLKPMLDALQGIVYVNDKQISHIELTRAFDKGRPRVELTVEVWASDTWQEEAA